MHRVWVPVTALAHSLSSAMSSFLLPCHHLSNRDNDLPPNAMWESNGIIKLRNTQAVALKIKCINLSHKAPNRVFLLLNFKAVNTLKVKFLSDLCLSPLCLESHSMNWGHSQRTHICPEVIMPSNMKHVCMRGGQNVIFLLWKNN